MSIVVPDELVGGRRRLAPPAPPPAMAPPDPAWVGGVQLDVGEHRVGVRADSPMVLDLVREVFGQWIVGDDQGGEDFGISVERRGGAGPRLIPQLLHGLSNVLRSRSLPRLLRRLDLELASLDHEVGGSAIRGMAAIVRNDGAALVPAAVAERSTSVERRIVAAGATIGEQAALRIDLAAQEVVVLPGLTGPDLVPQLIDRLATPPGRYRVRSIAWSADQVTADERPATAVARLAELVDLSDGDRQENLERVAALRDRLRPTPINRWDVELAAVLDTLDDT